MLHVLEDGVRVRTEDDAAVVAEFTDGASGDGATGRRNRRNKRGDGSGESKGFGFVCFKEPAAAERAVQAVQKHEAAAAEDGEAL